jgi:hypothetical protein
VLSTSKALRLLNTKGNRQLLSYVPFAHAIFFFLKKILVLIGLLSTPQMKNGHPSTPKFMYKYDPFNVEVVAFDIFLSISFWFMQAQFWIQILQMIK